MRLQKNNFHSQLELGWRSAAICVLSDEHTSLTLRQRFTFVLSLTSLPVGLEDVSTYPALFAELMKRGYSDEDLMKLAGKNLVRVFREVEKVQWQCAHMRLRERERLWERERMCTYATFVCVCGGEGWFSVLMMCVCAHACVCYFAYFIVSNGNLQTGNWTSHSFLQDKAICGKSPT